jgi:hypothetical protein
MGRAVWKEATMERIELDISNAWRFRVDPQNEGEEAGYARPEYDAGLWRELDLPCALERGHPDLEWYTGAGWYRRSLHAASSWAGRRVVLCFLGANYHSRVWVNGQLAGSNEDGFLPFEVALHPWLLLGQENTLVVRVDNDPRPGEVPGMNVGWRPYGGILREVRLLVTGQCIVHSGRITAEPAAAGAGALALTAEVRNEGNAPVGCCLQVEVRDAQGRPVGQLEGPPLALAAGAGGQLTVAGEMAGVHPWSPAHPVLYTARTRLRQGDEVLDEVTTRFGFRRIATSGPQLTLNGEPLTLQGFNRHEDSPSRGACSDLPTVRRDLLDMKALGANFVRLCHYPHHPGELDLCDELGLLAMGEIPVYGSTGMAEDEAQFGAKMIAAQRQLTTMVRRDWNHPSLIFWSVSNETHEQHAAVRAGNRALLRQARALDPTRLVVHVSDHWSGQLRTAGDCPWFDDDDVICLNAYPWMRDDSAATPQRLAEHAAWWSSNLARMHALYPEKPILISEFGYASLAGVHGGMMGEDLHAANLEANLQGMGAPYVCGTTIWCYADHAWPFSLQVGPTSRATVSISPFGVVTRQRQPKAAAYEAVRRLFADMNRRGRCP